MIPASIRAQFPQDEQGRVLFFTTPPIDTTHIVEGRSSVEKGDQLSHSLRYLAKKADYERELARKRTLDVDMDVDTETQNSKPATPESNKRVKPLSFAVDGEERDPDGRICANAEKAQQIAAQQIEQISKLKTRALAMLVQQLNQGNEEFYKIEYGDKADEVRKVDELKIQELRAPQTNGNMSVGKPDAMVEFKRSPWNGVYKDDFDARY